VEHIALQFMVPRWPERREQIERFARDVTPALQKGSRLDEKRSGLDREGNDGQHTPVADLVGLPLWLAAENGLGLVGVGD